MYRNYPKRKFKPFESSSCKLNEDQIEEIYIELREGTMFDDIAKMFNVSRQTIRNVNMGNSYTINGMIYPIVDRKRYSHGKKLKEFKEPPENSEFWDTYEPEPQLYWPKWDYRYDR
jgi:transposase